MSKRWLLLVVLGLTFGVYWAGLGGPLLFDDAQNLAPVNAWLQGRISWESVVLGNSSGQFGRPIAMASFVANVALLGKGVWGFKLVNLLFHLLNGTLVFALLSVVRQRMDVRHPMSDRNLLPLLATAIWLLHPLLVSTVLYVVQRMAILSATFTLLAMLAYLHGRIALEENRPRRAWTMFAMVPAATIAASLSKENGVLAPALCGVIEWFVFQPLSGERRNRWSRAWIVVTLVLPAAVAAALTLAGNRHIVGGYVNRPFTLAERLLTQPRALWDYVGVILLPNGPRLGLYHDDYPISHALLQPPSTLFAIIGWLAVVALAWRWRKAIPGFGLGVGIFLVGHAIESTVFPLLMYFEHRNYLPAIGAIWAALSLILFVVDRLRSRMDHADAVLAAAATSVVLALALATGGRTAIWSTLPTMLAQDLAYHPESPWLRVAAARWALEQSPPQPAVARQHLEHLLQSPDRDTQRLGAAARLIIDCAEGVGANPALVEKTFAGHPVAMESDLLTAYETLADAVLNHPCNGLSVPQFAADLDAMLDRMTLPKMHFMMRRMRYKVARMYLEAGELDYAAAQARLAHEGRVIAPMTALLAEIELRRGNMREAARLIDLADARIPDDDVTGQKVVGALRAKLASDLKEKAASERRLALPCAHDSDDCGPDRR